MIFETLLGGGELTVLKGTGVTGGSIQLLNPLNAELNPIRHLLALVGSRHIVHVSSRIRVKDQLRNLRRWPNIMIEIERLIIVGQVEQVEETGELRSRAMYL